MRNFEMPVEPSEQDKQQKESAEKLNSRFEQAESKARRILDGVFKRAKATGDPAFAEEVPRILEQTLISGGYGTRIISALDKADPDYFKREYPSAFSKGERAKSRDLNPDDEVAGSPKEQYELAGLTTEEQGAYEKFLANLKQLSEDVSTLRGVAKLSLQGLLKGLFGFSVRRPYTEQEYKLIESANDKLLKLQQGKKGVDVVI
jgi:hypothetical protein